MFIDVKSILNFVLHTYHIGICIFIMLLGNLRINRYILNVIIFTWLIYVFTTYLLIYGFSRVYNLAEGYAI